MAAPSQKNEDLSHEHLAWLVTNRSRNQASALRLHGLLEKYEAEINTDQVQNIAQALVSINFSLWRAVFLTDIATSQGFGGVLDGSRHFLKKLILDNAIAYPLDRTARDWSFHYYAANARYRLDALRDTRSWCKNEATENTYSLDTRSEGAAHARRVWLNHQERLELSISAFDDFLVTVKGAR